MLSADRVVFPGVGGIRDCMSALQVRGLLPILRELTEAVPFMGICLGMQALLDESEENNHTACLGLLPGRVLRFSNQLVDSAGRSLKIPHMGWNRVEMKKKHPLFEGVEPESEFYFVHAYYPAPENPRSVIGETLYGSPFASVLTSKNLVAVQFHPEKSGRPGLKILSNFCRWKGKDDA